MNLTKPELEKKTYKCDQCKDTGAILVPNGPDDAEWENCNVCDQEPIKNYAVEYMRRI